MEGDPGFVNVHVKFSSGTRGLRFGLQRKWPLATARAQSPHQQLRSGGPLVLPAAGAARGAHLSSRGLEGGASERGGIPERGGLLQLTIN